MYQQRDSHFRACRTDGGSDHACAHAHTSTDEHTQTDEHTPANEHTRPDEHPHTDQRRGLSRWQVAGGRLSGYVASLAVQGQVLNESGPVTYQFDTNGQARVTVDHFTMKVKAPVQGLTLNLNVVIDGEVTARYTGSPSDQLAFSNVQLDGLTVSAGTGKRTLFSGTPTEMADLFGLSLDPLFNTSTYSCRGDVLKYTPPLQNASEVVLKRVQ